MHWIRPRWSHPGSAVATALALCLVASVAVPQTIPATTPLSLWGPNGSVKAVARRDRMLVVGGTFDYVGPPTGSLAIVDATTGGLVGASRVPAQNITALASDGAGGWYAAISNRLQHLLPDGRVDPQFQAAATSLSGISTLAVHDSRVFAAGYFDRVGDDYRDRFAVFDRTTGALLPRTLAFGAAPHAIAALEVEGDTLVVGGRFESVDGAVRANVVLFDLTSDHVLPVAVPDVLQFEHAALTPTRLYVTGTCIGPAPATTVPVCAFDRVSGARLPWTPVLGGATLRAAPLVAAVPGAVVLAVMPFGAPATFEAFHPASGAVLWSVAADGDVQALDADDGAVFGAGRFTHVGGRLQKRLVKLDAGTGAVQPWTHAGDDATLIATDGARVAVGGLLVRSVGGAPRQAIVVLDLDTGRPASVQPTGLDFTAVAAVEVIGGVAVVAGTSPTHGGLRAFDLATGVTYAWDPLTSGTVSALATDGRRLFVAGYGVMSGQPLTGLGVIDAPTGIFSPAPGSPIECCIDGIEESSGAIHVRGNFRAVPGYGRSGFAAYDSSTLQLLPWSPPNVGPLRDLNGFAFWRERILISGQRAVWTDRNSGAALDTPVEIPAFTTGSGAVGRALDLVVYAGYTPSDGLVATAMDAASGRALPWRVPLQSVFNCCVSVVKGYSDLIVVGGVIDAAGGTPVDNLAVFRLPAPASPRHLTASVSGARVDLGWQAGGPTQSYEIEAGTAPGGVDVGTFPIAATSLTATVAPGDYYLRVRARGVTGLSAPSSEIVLRVPATTAPPDAPASLAASVSAGRVTLSWSAAGNATTYVLEAGTASGLANLGTLPTGHLDTAFTTSAPPGTYVVRVRAANAFGVSGSSNEVTIVVP